MQPPNDETLLRALKEATNVTPKTLESYRSSLRTLQAVMEGAHGERGRTPPLTWIACNPRTVLRRLLAEYSNDGTRRRFVAAVRALFKHNPALTETNPTCALRWGRALESLNALHKERAESGEPSEREREAWVPWKEVLRAERRLAEEDPGGPDHLLLAMYCLMEPLRQNFGNVRIYGTHPPAETAAPNHLILLRNNEAGGAGRAFLVLNDYKTSKRYGTFKRELPPPLVRILFKSLEAHPRRYLFVDRSGNPYEKQNSFTQHSNRTLERIFGRKVTVSLLRHAFISNLDFNEEPPSSLFQKARNMTHSIAMQQLYRRRVPTSADSQQKEGDGGEEEEEEETEETPGVAEERRRTHLGPGATLDPAPPQNRTHRSRGRKQPDLLRPGERVVVVKL